MPYGLAPSSAIVNQMESLNTDLAVIGAGPGGYAAAFVAADAGKNVILIEKNPRLGGACLNCGCIPSKALLHATHHIPAARESAKRGITFGSVSVDPIRLNEWKEGVLNKLAGGIAMLAKKRNVKVLTGSATFDSPGQLTVATADGPVSVGFTHAIIATGTQPAVPKVFDIGSPAVMTSTEALNLSSVPASMLVIGGGYIGMEMGTVYASLGTEVTLVEALDGILLGADPDLARPVLLYAKRNFKKVHLKTSVESLTTKDAGVQAVFLNGERGTEAVFEKVLVSVGRVPNLAALGIDRLGCAVDGRGFLVTNEHQQTTTPGVYAIGDIAGGILLAHKAAHEARRAVEHITGTSHSKSDPHIPAVVFTDPEVAWVGLTEAEAKAQEIPHTVAKFPWGACGRSLTQDRIDGATKLIIDPDTEKLLGIGMVGPGAGELIAEGTLALEMGATAADLANTVHPHPTLSESIMEAAEMFYGRAIHASPRT